MVKKTAALVMTKMSMQQMATMATIEETKIIMEVTILAQREKDMQISQINSDYAYKIQTVKTKPFMSWFHKSRLINNLQEQRDYEIKGVYQKFNSPKNQFGDYRKNDKKRW